MISSGAEIIFQVSRILLARSKQARLNRFPVRRCAHCARTGRSRQSVRCELFRKSLQNFFRKKIGRSVCAPIEKLWRE
jgi:hypothetical protein